MRSLSDAERDYLIEGLDDYIGLWQLAVEFRDLEPSASVERVREQALAEVRHLLEAGYMEAGRLADRGGFDPWGTGPEETLARIAREWETLGKDPNIPDICWFSNTALGDQVARELLSNPGPSPDSADT